MYQSAWYVNLLNYLNWYFQLLERCAMFMHTISMMHLTEDDHLPLKMPLYVLLPHKKLATSNGVKTKAMYNLLTAYYENYFWAITALYDVDEWALIYLGVTQYENLWGTLFLTLLLCVYLYNVA